MTSPEPEVRVRSYEVSCLPEDSINNLTLAVRVEWTSTGLWAIRRGARACLGRDGTWEWESIPSERKEDWLVDHRFPLEEALKLAKDAAPRVVVNGMTPAQVLEWEANQ